jgi:hypothetical protein
MYCNSVVTLFLLIYLGGKVNNSVEGIKYGFSFRVILDLSTSVAGGDGR